MKLFFPRAALSLFFLINLAACDRMITPPSEQAARDAKRKAAAGEYLRAINLYERALDGSEESADIHYELALLYDDKMNEPLNALHHFKRYLTLAPTGRHAADAKDFMKRDELAVITSLSGDTMLPRSEAARLRNENLKLSKLLQERSAPARATEASDKSRRGSPDSKTTPVTTVRLPPRSHVVEPGDTLFSLSRKYYNSPDHWKAILNANKKSVEDPAKLKVGQTLVIP